MITKNQFKRAYAYIQLAGISLCFIQISCGAPPPALHYDVPCPPAEARNKLRQSLSTRRIRTSETAPDNKSFAITTDSITEKSGKRESRIVYKLEIKPAENANTSIIDLSKETVEAKGARERDWSKADAIGVESQFEQQIAKEIETFCRPGQP